MIENHGLLRTTETNEAVKWFWWEEAGTKAKFKKRQLFRMNHLWPEQQMLELDRKQALDVKNP